MKLGRLQLKVKRGATIKFTIDTSLDLTNYTITSEIRNSDGDGELLGTFTCTKQLVPGTTRLGRILFVLSHNQADALVPGVKDQCFDLKLDLMDGETVAERVRTNKIWLEVEGYGTR